MRRSQDWTAQELVAETGVPLRTLHYYIAERLLEPPQGRGRHAVYNDDHLHRLRLIKRLRETHLPLKEIAERLETLSPQEIAELAQGEGVSTGANDPAPSETVFSDPASPAAPNPAANAARDYIERVLASQSADRTETPGSPSRSRGASSRPSAPEDSKAALSLRLSTLDSPEKRELNFIATPPSNPPSRETAPAEQWRRISLAPGLELHLRLPASPPLRRLVDRILRLVAQSGESEPTVAEGDSISPERNRP